MTYYILSRYLYITNIDEQFFPYIYLVNKLARSDRLRSWLSRLCEFTPDLGPTSHRRALHGWAMRSLSSEPCDRCEVMAKESPGGLFHAVSGQFLRENSGLLH